MKKSIFAIFLAVGLFLSCSKSNDLPPDIKGSTWDLFTFIDPPGLPGTAVITFNANNTITSVPAAPGNTWTLSDRDIIIKYIGNLEFRGQLKSMDTLMGGTIYKAGSPNGFWSAEKK